MLTSSMPAGDAGNAALRADVARFQSPSLGRSLGQTAVTFSLFVGVCAAMYATLGVSGWITAALTPLAAGLLVRIFIIQHDCGHGAYFRSGRANLALGLLCSLVTFTPYAHWRRQHALHHGVWNDLDRRRSDADIYSTCTTVAEFLAMSPWQRRWHRLSRHPLVANVVLPPLVFLALYRWPFDAPASWRRERIGVHLTNLALLGVFLGLGLLVGFGPIVAVQLPVLVTASIIGVWLFSVQHRFERTVWLRHDQWTATTAALRGSSHLCLPTILRWFTGSIGLHHIHHLNPRVPNYRLQDCQDAVRGLDITPRLSLRGALAAVSLTLWDERRQRMVTCRDAQMRALRD